MLTGTVLCQLAPVCDHILAAKWLQMKNHCLGGRVGKDGLQSADASITMSGIRGHASGGRLFQDPCQL